MKNDNIVIQSFNSKLETAKGIIKYTLLLDYDILDTKPLDSSTFVEEIRKRTHKCCEGVFGIFYNNDLLDTNSYKHNAYYFFGNTTKATFDNKSNLLNNKFMSDYTIQKLLNLGKANSDLTLFDLILDDCVLMAYHTLLTIFIESQESKNRNVTSYQLPTIKENGTLLYIKKNYFKHLKGNTDSYVKDPDPSLASNINSYIKKIIENKIDSFSFLYDEIIDNSAHKKLKYKPQFASILSTIKLINITTLKSLYSPGIKSPHAFINHLFSINKCNLTHEYTQYKKDIVHKKDTNKSQTLQKNSAKITYTVDDIYDFWLMEKILPCNLLIKLLTLIREIELKSRYIFQSKEKLKLLSNCIELPNSLSRSFFLGYALATIDHSQSNMYSFWNMHDITKTIGNSPIILDQTKSHGFDFPIWSKQYKQFFLYFSQYVIPIYHWCFLCIFLDSLENKGIESKKLLEKSICLLSDYITQNSNKIIQPLKNTYLDFLCENDADNLYSYFEPDTLITLKNIFFQNICPEMNIKELTPKEFILNSPPKNTKQQLQDFYLNNFIQKMIYEENNS